MDLFDAVLELEQELAAAGAETGRQRGRHEGRADGERVGREKGAVMGSTVGAMAGAVWAVQRAAETQGRPWSEKEARMVSRILERAAAFPHGRLTEEIQAPLQLLQAKFRVWALLVGFPIPDPHSSDLSF